MKKVTLILIGFLLSNIAYCQTEKSDTIVDYIKSETIDGKLDFKKALVNEGKDKKLLVYDKVAYSPDDFAILLWGQAVKRLGIRSYKKAMKLWEDIYMREMIAHEKKALKTGFKLRIE